MPLAPHGQDPDRLAELGARFTSVSDLSGFVAVLRHSHHLLHEEAEIDWLSPRLVTALAFHGTRRYRSFSIPKRSGGEREIRAPQPKLKAVQRALNLCFHSVFQPHRTAYGFVPGRSIADNAALHVGRNWVLNLDLEGFFPSTSFRRVKTVLGLDPFAFRGEREELGFLIANLCCDGGALPQGAPTSPTLTNAVCQRLDRRLNRLARENRARYSRYAGDLTFSSNASELGEPFEEQVRSIIVDEGYAVNEAKVRRQSAYVRQEVTGLTVNDRLNVPRAFIDDIRFSLTLWEKHGYDQASAHFLDRNAHRYPGRRPPALEYVLGGRLAFLAMVRGADDPLVLRLRERLNRLEGGTNPSPARRSSSGGPQETHASSGSVKRILDVWEAEGLKAALDHVLHGKKQG